MNGGLKCYYVCTNDVDEGLVLVHALSSVTAKAIIFRISYFFSMDDFRYLRALRQQYVDDKPVNLVNSSDVLSWIGMMDSRWRNFHLTMLLIPGMLLYAGAVFVSIIETEGKDEMVSLVCFPSVVPDLLLWPA